MAAELFAAEGADVVIADVNDGADAVEAIDAGGGRAAFVSTDVTDEESVRSAVEFATALQAPEIPSTFSARTRQNHLPAGSGPITMPLSAVAAE